MAARGKAWQRLLSANCCVVAPHTVKVNAETISTVMTPTVRMPALQHRNRGVRLLMFPSWKKQWPYINHSKLFDWRLY